jgi:solute carrier family 34 (sodium-dependent phosphate cotransporter)
VEQPASASRPHAPEHGDAVGVRRPRFRLTPRTVVRLAAAFGGLFLFIFALEVIKSGARGIVPLLDNLQVAGPTNAVGFGWLLAYGALSGSPVAAIGVTLLSAGALTQAEAFGVIGGSRLGASFIVLAVGFFLYMTRRRNADGLYIGVVALLTTFTTQGPAILLGLVSLHFGWLDRVSFATPAGLLDVTDAVYGPPVGFIDGLLPGALVFLAGVGILLLSFAVFDRALPQLQGEAEGISRALRSLDRRPLMFLLGCAVTLTTLSVSISLTALVPLSLKGYLKREHIIPYVMGANITTFVDTLVASVLLGGHGAFVVVLTEMVSVAVISLFVLTFLYKPYAKVILAGAQWTTASPRHLGVFLGAIVAVPLVLLFW